jgi:hypothetical protein
MKESLALLGLAVSWSKATPIGIFRGLEYEMTSSKFSLALQPSSLIYKFFVSIIIMEFEYTMLRRQGIKRTEI